MATERYFYQRDERVAQVGRKPVRLMYGQRLLAQLVYDDSARIDMLQVDQRGSMLGGTTASNRRTYTAYGYSPDATGEFLSGFNGQPMDLVMQGYPLGRGKRFYKPACGIFCSPDPLSPFGNGGINSYVYCAADPVNFVDPSGLARQFPINPPPPYTPRRSSSGSALAESVQGESARRSRRVSEEPPTYSEAMKALQHIELSEPNVTLHGPRVQQHRVRPTYQQAMGIGVPEEYPLEPVRSRTEFERTRSSSGNDSVHEVSQLSSSLRSLSERPAVKLLAAFGVGVAVLTAVYFIAAGAMKVRE